MEATIGGEELEKVLSSYAHYEPLSMQALNALAAETERVFVPAGEQIYRRGARLNEAFIVEHGRLRANSPLVDKITRIEMGRGEVIGVNFMLSQYPFDGDVFAIRDCRLLRLGREGLLRAMASAPELIESTSRIGADLYLRSHGRRAARTRPRTFTLLPVGDDPDLSAAADQLLGGLEGVGGSRTLVDSARVAEFVGRDPAEPGVFDDIRRRVVAWCEEREEEGTSLLLLCDADQTPWTRWCLQQTDRIVVVAKAADTGSIARIAAVFAGREVAGAPVLVDLLLVQDPACEIPQGTRPWMELPCRRRHFHVRLGNEGDFRRAARRLREKAIGVVLGGGGARGFAHIGALQALEEAGVPIDAVGGTSMGSVMAAVYARGWSPQRILELVRDVFQDARSVIDLDFPMVALLGGRKLDSVLHSVFEEIDVSDFWLPSYCISSSLTSASMVVHDRGLAWQCLRASCSLPGIFPPVHADGELLVDGGIVNNVPMDIMGKECEGGTVIAIDVGGGGAQHFDAEHAQATGWRLLLNRLNPRSKDKRIANIFLVLMWASTLSSKQ
jgi:NTE family protein